MVAEFILHGGTIRTMDSRHPIAEAVAVNEGRIVAVGRREDVDTVANANTRWLDLGGRTLIPAFNDAHVHLWKVGLLLTSMLDARITATPTIAAIVEGYKARAAKAPAGTWLLGRGYNNVTLPERRHPMRYDLDKASTAHPIVLTHTSAHAAAVNSKALELAGITRNTPDPEGGTIERDESGEPTGVLHETAMAAINRVQPPPTDAEFEEAIIVAAKAYLRMGITSITDPGVSPAQVEVYRRSSAARRLPIRANVMGRYTLDDGTDVPLPERTVNEWLRVDTVKLFADGGLSAGNAAISVPYRNDTSHKGFLRVSDEEMQQTMWEIHRAGLRIATHAVGDVAIEQVISAIEYVESRLAPTATMMHRIEHYGLPTADHLRRCRGRIAVVPQTIFIYALGASFLNYVPDELIPRLYPLRYILDAGLVTALSSDAPVVPDANPLLGMAAAARRLSAEGKPLALEQSVGAEETLPLYTSCGAIVAGEGHFKGTITPGKVADFAVLSGDPLSVPAEALTDLKVDMTIIDGQIVYER
jgi:predicted amidohydrolase YtcJ